MKLFQHLKQQIRQVVLQTLRTLLDKPRRSRGLKTRANTRKSSNTNSPIALAFTSLWPLKCTAFLWNAGWWPLRGLRAILGPHLLCLDIELNHIRIFSRRAAHRHRRGAVPEHLALRGKPVAQFRVQDRQPRRVLVRRDAAVERSADVMEPPIEADNVPNSAA